MTDSEPKPSLGGRRGGTVRARGDALLGLLEGSRPEHLSIEAGFRWIARDKAIAGGVLGGGLAYRFFFWLLALAVVAAGGLGFASSSGADVEGTAGAVGLRTSLASSIGTAAEQSETGRWWLLATGVVLFMWFSWGLLRALRLVHAAAWQVKLEPLRSAPRSVATILAAPVVLIGLSAAASWARGSAGGIRGLLVTLAVSLGFGALWLLVSLGLPSADVPWTAFLPGAVLLGIGLQGLHVFTVYFLEEKLAHASQLYGALGLAATMLFYLFLIGRGFVWAAELNAVVWELRHPERTS
jgi:uncharacterized BrkB/YihY/UPF0761 family membrane protein